MVISLAMQGLAFRPFYQAFQIVNDLRLTRIFVGSGPDQDGGMIPLPAQKKKPDLYECENCGAMSTTPGECCGAPMKKKKKSKAAK